MSCASSMVVALMLAAELAVHPSEELKEVSHIWGARVLLDRAIQPL